MLGTPKRWVYPDTAVQTLKTLMSIHDYLRVFELRRAAGPVRV